MNVHHLFETDSRLSSLPVEPWQPGLEFPMNTGTVAVRFLDYSGRLSEPICVTKIVKSDAAWRAQLTDAQYRVTRTHGTEQAFCGLFHTDHRTGIYTCIGCGLPLFHSGAKFDSGTGWPSFFQPLSDENVGKSLDDRFGMTRTEIHCRRCDSHLGHAFNDGPEPTGMRFCLNSESLSFHERPATANQLEKVLFGCGCFWCIQDIFDPIRGITGMRAGYAGGHTRQPTYLEVCTHETGHAEVVEIEFDPARVSFQKLLDLFWQNTDPFAAQRIGPETGSQYRSAIFFTAPEQETVALTTVARLKRLHAGMAVTTEMGLAKFYPAEEFHQKFQHRHGLKNCRI